MDDYQRGLREYEGLVGGDAELDQAGLRAASPELYDTLVRHGFGGMLAGAELSRAQRELATVAIIATLGGAPTQLARHTAAALRHGIGPDELRALCGHLAGYAGFPRALNALTVIDETLTEAGHARPPALHRVRLADHETLVAQRGTAGPPVVLVHALGLDWRMWQPVLDTLAVGRRIFAYDVRGHGAAAGAPVPGDMARLGADFHELLDALDLDSVHAVGLSYGGGVVQSAAVRAPERIASLSLLATTDAPFDAFAGRAKAAEEEGVPAQVVPTLLRWFTPAGLAANGWGVRYARERVLRDDVADWAGAWRAFMDFPVREQFARLTMPSLVVAGGADVSAPPELMRGIAERLPDATFQELPGVPHMLTLEDADQVGSALDAFLPVA
ncbi:MAG TPA: alpha/beta fold hydrolase [Pseudonocardiaceae bacterium]|nr:alpha/beta fold hydrolase [Pseudonocardiaceae bacterium]